LPDAGQVKLPDTGQVNACAHGAQTSLPAKGINIQSWRPVAKPNRKLGHSVQGFVMVMTMAY
jgi:hypothetical protein